MSMFLKWGRKSRLSTLVLISLGSLVFSAAQWQPEAVAKSYTTGKIVYDPSSGSYFEIIRSTGDSSSWRAARTAVSKRIHKGIRARLAVIKTRATHEFLRKNLGNLDRVWIGLRYHCSTRKLVWVTGEILRPGIDFEIWSSQWYRNRTIMCSNQDLKYMPVYYTLKGLGLYWQASGSNKAFPASLVEFPKP